MFSNKVFPPDIIPAANPDFDLASTLFTSITCDYETEDSPSDIELAFDSVPESSPASPRSMNRSTTSPPPADLNFVQSVDFSSHSLQSPTLTDSRKRRLEKKKTSGHDNRKKRRTSQKRDVISAAGAENDIRESIRKRYNDQGPKTLCDMDTEKIRVASTGFVALNERWKSERAYTLAEATGEGSELGFELQEWDGRYVSFATSTSLVNNIFEEHLSLS